MKTVLITGATRGLGLAIARALDARDDMNVVLAVRDRTAGERVARALRRPARVVTLEMSSLDAVAAFVRAWREPLWGLVNNAGLQQTVATSYTAEGFEQTLAVNYLAPTWLTLGLLPQLRGGRVMAIGSGTHNPEVRSATLFGFRGGRFSSVHALANGESDASSERQRGLDRYATSKLLIMASMMELAQRVPATTFLTLDPGPMPGTGLARGAPPLVRVAWKTVLPLLVPVVPGASTPRRSARAAAQLLSAQHVVSGEVYDFRAQPSQRVWSEAKSPALGRAALDQAIELLTRRWPLATLPPDHLSKSA
jgi:NAD(P)-dependent dehydrogenase (short-subunit alcohol dehydrogenase family)